MNVDVSTDIIIDRPRSYLHGHSALFRASSRQAGNGWKAAALIPNRF